MITLCKYGGRTISDIKFLEGGPLKAPPPPHQPPPESKGSQKKHGLNRVKDSLPTENLPKKANSRNNISKIRLLWKALCIYGSDIFSSPVSNA